MIRAVLLLGTMSLASGLATVSPSSRCRRAWCRQRCRSCTSRTTARSACAWAGPRPEEREAHRRVPRERRREDADGPRRQEDLPDLGRGRQGPDARVDGHHQGRGRRRGVRPDRLLQAGQRPHRRAWQKKFQRHSGSCSAPATCTPERPAGVPAARHPDYFIKGHSAGARRSRQGRVEGDEHEEMKCYAQAMGMTDELVAEVQRGLKELDEMIYSEDCCRRGPQLRRHRLWARMRSITIVKGVKVPESSPYRRISRAVRRPALLELRDLRDRGAGPLAAALDARGAAVGPGRAGPRGGRSDFTEGTSQRARGLCAGPSKLIGDLRQLALLPAPRARPRPPPFCARALFPSATGRRRWRWCG